MFITCFSQRSGHSLSFFWVRFLINVCFRYTDTWCFVGLKLGQQCIPLIESWGKRWLQWSWKEESWMEDSIVQESCEEHLILWHYKDKRGWIKIKIRKKNLANDPKQTATQRWASLLDTRLKREGRTVPSRDPLNEATPEFHMDWGWRPRMSSVRVAMRPPSAQPRPAWTWPSKMETRMRRPRKGLLTNIV